MRCREKERGVERKEIKGRERKIGKRRKEEKQMTEEYGSVRDREREKQQGYSSMVLSLASMVLGSRGVVVGADEKEGIKPCSAARSIQPPPLTPCYPYPRPFFRSLFTDPHPSRPSFFVSQPSFLPDSLFLSSALATFLYRYHCRH